MNLSAYRNKAILLLASALVVALSVTLCFAWGMTGHHMVTLRAVELLGDELRPFMRANIENLLAFSNEPDAISAVDSAEGPNHYFDLDKFAQPPFGGIPSGLQAFVGKYGAEALASGRLPWAAAERYRTLVTAFRTKDYGEIIVSAAHLSHYVADSTMPLHATANYKGQYSGNVIFPGDGPERHVHVRYEIGMVDAHRDEIRRIVAARAVAIHRVSDPAGEVLANLKAAYPFIDGILEADRALISSQGPLPAAYYAGMYERAGESAARQIGRAAEDVASFWQSAWLDAGKPQLTASRVILSQIPRRLPVENDKPETTTENPK